VSAAVTRETSARRNTLWANAALATSGCLWGTGFLFGKIAFREMTVSDNVCYRFIFGCTLLLPILLRKKKFFRGSDLRLLLVASFIGVPVQFLLQFKGLQLTTVSHASLIVGALPVLLALSSVWFLHERLNRVEWIVLFISPLGVLTIALSTRNSSNASGPSLTGDLLVFISMLAATVMILLTKRLSANYDSLQITSWMLVLGCVELLVIVECMHPIGFHFSRHIWLAAAAQGVLATAAAYLCWNWGLAHVPASRAAVFLNLEPLLGTFLGVMILHETLGPMAILGGAMILGPAIYFSRKPATV
jgi:drug/metabolite transporter (DMT)-like permease